MVYVISATEDAKKNKSQSLLGKILTVGDLSLGIKNPKGKKYIYSTILC